MVMSGVKFMEHVCSDLSEPGGHPGGRGMCDQWFVPAPVLHQIGDRDHAQPMLFGELGQLGQSRHFAVVLDDLG